jgi:hypothetical protein
MIIECPQCHIQLDIGDAKSTWCPICEYLMLDAEKYKVKKLKKPKRQSK